MTTELQSSSAAIISEQKMIEENKKQRNQRYHECMDGYLNHLKKQIEQLQSTEQMNDERNTMISSAFQNAYDRIVISSQMTLRKIKQTSYQKHQFWQNLIKNNSGLTDLQLKKQFYLQKRDAENKYFDSVDSLKQFKKVPYNVLVGKVKKNQSLRQWQANNRTFQEKVNKGTETLNQWRAVLQKNTNINNFGSTNQDLPNQIIQDNYIRTSYEPKQQTLYSNYGASWQKNLKDQSGILKNFIRKV